MQLELRNMTSLKRSTHIFTTALTGTPFNFFKMNFIEPEQTIVESNQRRFASGTNLSPELRQSMS